MKSNNRSRALAGIALLLFAIYLGWLGISYESLPAELFHAPRWIFYLLSFLLGASAGLAFLGQNHPLTNIVAALIWVLFAVVGGWLAFFSPLEELSGGISLLSPDVNRALARGIFGLGAVLNLGAGIYALWLHLKD
jgi:hypothetical protein